jgi:DNA polymerase III subunit gamma/tau
MSYLVIARKYRPLNFGEVIGQEHVTQTITNAIRHNKVHHAYLLTGPRGVGKTTISRILAKSLNCETGVTPTPCGICSNCKEIDAGISLDVKEIDGASNRGIDEIRDLRDDIKFSPAKSRKKIYIIDEVHMLTNQAFNALLKTLEEPPEHAVFIFATTEINEVPATILSRCQRHDFKRVEIDVLSAALKKICDKEGVEIDEESLIMICKAGDGSVRDSQSALDQVIAFTGGKITSDLAYEALGLPALGTYFEFTDIILSKDTGKLYSFVDGLFSKGLHIISFIKGLNEFFRDMLIYKTVKDAKILDMTADNAAKLAPLVAKFGEKDLLMFMDILSQAVSKLKSSPFQRMDFELILLKILHHEPVTDLALLIERFSKVEGELEIDPDFIIDEIIKKMGGMNFKAPLPTDICAQKDEGIPEEPKVPEMPEKITEPVTEESPASVPEPELEEDKKKTPEAEPEPVETEPEPIEPVITDDKELDIQQIRSRWEAFLRSDKMKDLKLGALDYGVPAAIREGSELMIKFDPVHSTLASLCRSKLEILETVLNDFFGSAGLKITFFEEKVQPDERVIAVRENLTQTPEEKKKALLEKAPHLKFLFEDPLNCKIID